MALKNSAKVHLDHHILESLSIALLHFDNLLFLHKPTELGRVVASQDGDGLVPPAGARVGGGQDQHQQKARSSMLWS